MRLGLRAVGLENRPTLAAHLDNRLRRASLFGRYRWSGSPSRDRLGIHRLVGGTDALDSRVETRAHGARMCLVDITTVFGKRNS